MTYDSTQIICLRSLDLKDAVAKRPVLTKPQYINRVRQVLKSKKAQRVAGNCARKLRAICKLVRKKKGAASGK